MALVEWEGVGMACWTRKSNAMMCVVPPRTTKLHSFLLVQDFACPRFRAGMGPQHVRLCANRLHCTPTLPVLKPKLLGSAGLGCGPTLVQH